jgi:hypothetical protein
MKEKFKYAKRRVISSLESGNYDFEARFDIDVKNLLAIGEITANELIKIIKSCGGMDHECSPHRQCTGFLVHVMKPADWYIKFYFVDDSEGYTVFISVHK